MPPSKSMAHRAILCAALSGGNCTVRNLSLSADIEATLGAVAAMDFRLCFPAENCTPAENQPL